MDLTVVVSLLPSKSYSLLTQTPSGVHLVCVGDKGAISHVKSQYPDIQAEWVEDVRSLSIQTEFVAFYHAYENWAEGVWGSLESLCREPELVISRCGLGFIETALRVQYATEYQPQLMKPLQIHRNLWFPIDFSPVSKYVFHAQLLKSYSLALPTLDSLVDQALFEFDYHMIMLKEKGEVSVIYEPIAFSTKDGIVTQVDLMKRYRYAMFDKLEHFDQPMTRLWAERKWILRNRDKYLLN